MQQKALGDTIHVDDAVRMYVLHPSEDDRDVRNLNNGSLVVKLVYGETAILLSGDAEQEAEEKILRRYDRFLQSDILKAGHHGSMTSSSAAFVNRTRPTRVVISVGLRNKFHHPSQEVLERFRASGAVVRRTDYDGAIVLRSDGRSWKEVDWRRSGY
jgi:competence protein ComEC